MEHMAKGDQLVRILVKIPNNLTEAKITFERIK